jgi:hypothetical protein
MTMLAIEIHEADLVEMSVAPEKAIGEEVDRDRVRPTEIVLGQFENWISQMW